MKLKLSKSEFEVLINILSQIWDSGDVKPKSIYGLLLSEILRDLYLKLYKRGPVVKLTYNVTLSRTESIAFYLAFQSHQLPVTSFEGNLLNKLRSEIHKATASLIS